MLRARAIVVVPAVVAIASCAARYTVEPGDAGATVDAQAPTPDADAGTAKDADVADAAGDERAAPDASPLEGVCGSDCHVVFVSSKTYAGVAVGGIAGADAKCQALAAASRSAAIQARAARFAAWISTGNANSPGMTTRLPAAGRFRRVDGATIADSVPELLSGNIRVTVNLDENGEAIQTGGLQGASWTGTQGNGRTSGATCADWSGAGVQGDIGRATSTDSTWTNYAAVDCTLAKHLYCFDRF